MPFGEVSVLLILDSDFPWHRQDSSSSGGGEISERSGELPVRAGWSVRALLISNTEAARFRADSLFPF